MLATFLSHGAARAALIASCAAAFCGFYVSGADAKLFDNATQVVLMREGTRTVLSMQNSYQGPPSDFAMVVPVPVILSEETVKTLPMGIFDDVDRMASPRLVEYWEVDPCAPDYYPEDMHWGLGRGYFLVVSRMGSQPSGGPVWMSPSQASM